MTAEILKVLIAVNLAAAAAIVLVLTVARPLRRAFGARLAYAAWLIVPAAAAASLLPARISLQPAAAAPALAPLPFVTASEVSAAAAPAAALQIDWSLIAVGGWALGVVVLIALTLWTQVRTLRLIGRLTPEGPLVRAANPAIGPAILGVLRPRIMVPADFEQRFDEPERAVILAHEQTHIAGGDLRINAALELVRCLLWFNPLVHLAIRQVRIAQELACDEAVIARYPRARRTYAQALLKTLTVDAPLPLGCYWPPRAAGPMKERLTMLTRPAPGAARKFAGAAAIGIVALGAAVAAWAAQPPRSVTTPASFQPPASVRATTPAPTPLAAPASATDEAPPPIPILPANVSLTNAGGAAPTWYVRDEAALARAIAASDIAGIIKAGGTPGELAAMLRTHCDQPDWPRCRNIPNVGEEKWGNFTNGDIGLAGPIGDWSNGPGGFIVMGAPAMKGIRAPEDVLAQQRQVNADMASRTPPELRGATMVGEPFTTPEGTPGTRITGYRLTTGEVLSREEYQQRMTAGLSATAP